MTAMEVSRVRPVPFYQGWMRVRERVAATRGWAVLNCRATMTTQMQRQRRTLDCDRQLNVRLPFLWRLTLPLPPLLQLPPLPPRPLDNVNLVPSASPPPPHLPTPSSLTVFGHHQPTEIRIEHTYQKGRVP